MGCLDPYKAVQQATCCTQTRQLGTWQVLDEQVRQQHPETCDADAPPCLMMHVLLSRRLL